MLLLYCYIPRATTNTMRYGLVDAIVEEIRENVIFQLAMPPIKIYLVVEYFSIIIVMLWTVMACL